MRFLFYSILLIVALIWVVVYSKWRKAIRIVPFVLVIYLEGFISNEIVPALYWHVLRHISSIRNINEGHAVTYRIVSLLMLVLGIIVSKDFKSKVLRLLYIASVFLFNIILIAKISPPYLWK